jgi:hypothetical protein
MKFIGSIFAAAALVLMAMPAHAFTPLWSAPAKGCVPDEASAGRYSTTGPGVAHLNTNVAPIRLVCPIDGQLGGTVAWNFVVTYRDSTGAATSANVTARVIRLSRAAGNQSVVTTFDSNGSAATGVAKGTIAFNHLFNFDTNYYSVVIQLGRTLASQIVQVFGVALESTEP